jgi:hypothetical protein
VEDIDELSGNGQRVLPCVERNSITHRWDNSVTMGMAWTALLIWLSWTAIIVAVHAFSGHHDAFVTRCIRPALLASYVEPLRGGNSI